MSKIEITEAYQMLYDFHKILKNNVVKYFVYGDTLNDLLKYKGIVPDEGIVYVGLKESEFKKLLNMTELFKKCGYSLTKLDGVHVICGPHVKIVISVFEKDGDKFYIQGKTEDLFIPKQHIKASEMGYKKVSVGKLELLVLKGSKKYLERYYKNISGEDPSFVPTPKERKCQKEPEIKGNLLEKIGVVTKGGKKEGCENKIAGKKIESFFINCDVHEKRKKKFLKHLKASDLKSCREVCVNGKALTRKILCKMMSKDLVDSTADLNPIEIAISFSHYNIWKRFLAGDAEYALVFEDDAEIHPQFKTMLSKTLKKLWKNNHTIDILWLWNGNWADTLKYAKKVAKIDEKITIMRETTGYTAGAVSYVISKKFAKHLVDRMFPIYYPVDIYMGDKSFSEGIADPLFVKMTHNKKKGCYLSPFFVGEDWVCGGEHGTGDTTQVYEAEQILDLHKDCKNIK